MDEQSWIHLQALEDDEILFFCEPPKRLNIRQQNDILHNNNQKKRLDQPTTINPKTTALAPGILPLFSFDFLRGGGYDAYD